MPSQNATDVYQLMCGFAPCAVDKLDCTLFQPSNANLIYYPSHLIPGDIMAVNPGTEDGILSGDTWWLPQVSRGLPTSKTSNGCHVPGFWLEMVPSSQQPVHGCALRLQRGNTTIYYGSVTKSCSKPTVTPVEPFNTGWKHGSVVYKWSDEYVQHLCKVSDNFLMTFCVPDESASCEESEEEDIDAVNSL